MPRRVHVELGPDHDRNSVAWHVDLAGRLRSEIDLQLVAFPQHGWTNVDGMDAAMYEAMVDGCTVVGGCPYADPDPADHVRRMFDLAERFDAADRCPRRLQ